MKALVLGAAEGIGAASLKDVADTSPAPGEVRVRLRGASLNHRELWIARGQYPGMKLPCILGADGAGIVDAVGEGVDSALLGRECVIYPGMEWGDDQRFPSPRFHLLGMPAPGTIAEAITVPASNLAPKPAHLDFAAAAALPTGAVTAWRGLTTKGALAAGETLLITGIGGGVATFALLFGVAMGAKVYVTSSSQETIDLAVKLGATAGFNYKNADWAKEFRTASGGADVVFDGAPSASLPAYLRTLKLGARVVVYGSTGGVQTTFSAPDLFLRHAAIYGTAMGSPQEFGDMLRFVEEKKIQPVVEKAFTLDQSAEALQWLEGSHAFGKIVVVI